MAIFLGISVAVSLGLILLGFAADRSAIVARINGANGLPILVALLLSFAGSLGVAIIAALFGDLERAALVALCTIPYHAILGAVLIWRLQSLATRVKQAEDLRRQKFEDWFGAKSRR